MNKILKLKLHGLNCANCANKIEEKVNELQFVNKANLNFVNKTLSIDLNEKSKQNETFNEVRKIVNNIEQGVNVLNDGEEIEEDKNFVLISIIRFVIGCLLFFCAVISEGIVGNLLFVVSYIIFGYDVLIRAIKNIIKGEVFDENFLMSIATLGAFYIKEYPEAVAVMLFYQIGEFFQDLAVDRSRKSIKDLMDINVETANLITDQGIISVSPDSVDIGQVVMIKVGEKVPLDGIIIEGDTRVDMKALTGESEEVKVKVGENVLSGAINKSNVIKVRVNKEYKDSTVSRIMDLVENAVGNKSKVESFITKFAKIYTPIVVGSAVLLAVVPMLFGGEFNVWLSRALVFLVSSCPCALVVSIPLTFFSGLGESSKRGVLIKGSNYLQALSEIDTVVFDKTGTLTKGVFEVSDIIGDSNQLLKYAASVEAYSNHPLATAVIKKYDGELFEVSNIEEMGGYGLVGEINNSEICVGNIKLMESKNIEVNYNNTIGTVIYVSLDGKLLGEIVVSDIVRDNSKIAIDNLKKLGISDLVMLTGDRKNIAESIAKKLGIANVFAELLPQDKVFNIEKLYTEKNDRKIAFIGDGINDAPVLARVDVGVAMGGIGSDAAIEAADVVIMNDDISKLSEGIAIARKTMRIARENVIIVLAIKIIVLILASLGFANMWLAVFADVGVALIAIINSLKNKL